MECLKLLKSDNNLIHEYNNRNENNIRALTTA